MTSWRARSRSCTTRRSAAGASAPRRGRGFAADAFLAEAVAVLSPRWPVGHAPSANAQKCAARTGDCTASSAALGACDRIDRAFGDERDADADADDAVSDKCKETVLQPHGDINPATARGDAMNEAKVQRLLGELVPRVDAMHDILSREMPDHAYTWSKPSRVGRSRFGASEWAALQLAARHWTGGTVARVPAIVGALEAELAPYVAEAKR